MSNAETFADIRLAITQEDEFTSLLVTATWRLSHSHLSLWPMNINESYRVQPSMKNMGALVVPLTSDSSRLYFSILIRLLCLLKTSETSESTYGQYHHLIKIKSLKYKERNTLNINAIKTKKEYYWIKSLTRTCLGPAISVERAPSLDGK